MKRMGKHIFTIKKALFGTALPPAYERGGLTLIFHSFRNVVQPYFYTSIAADIARKKRVPRRIQWAISLSALYLILAILGISVISLHKIVPKDMVHYLIIIFFGASVVFRLIEEIIVPRRNLEFSLERLVETDGVVPRPSVEGFEESLPDMEDSDMVQTMGFLPVSLEVFEKDLQHTKDTLEKRTEASLRLSEIAFAESKLAGKIEFEKIHQNQTEGPA